MTRIEELMIILMEECAEVTQAASKVIRFGEENNIKDLEKEIGDLQCMLDMVHEEDLISWTAVEQYSECKRMKLRTHSNLFE